MYLLQLFSYYNLVTFLFTSNSNSSKGLRLLIKFTQSLNYVKYDKMYGQIIRSSRSKFGSIHRKTPMSEALFNKKASK